MRLAWFVLLISLGGGLGSRHHKRPKAFDFPAVAEATGLPRCAHTCLSDLFVAAVEFINLKDPVTKFKDLCRTYNNASLCIAEQENCFTETAVEFAFSGIEELCNGKNEELKAHSKCLKKESEGILEDCDGSCFFTDSIVKLSMRENIRRLSRIRESHNQLVWEITPVCTSLGCMSACIARRMNTDCGEPSGTIIIETILKPFITASALMEEIPPRSRFSVLRRVPAPCRYLISTSALREISMGVAPETSEGLPEEGSGEEASGEGSGEVIPEASGEVMPEASGEVMPEASGEELLPKPLPFPMPKPRPYFPRIYYVPLHRPRHSWSHRRPRPRVRPVSVGASTLEEKSRVFVLSASSSKKSRIERNTSHSQEHEKKMHVVKPNHDRHSRESEEMIHVIKPRSSSNSRESREKFHMIKPQRGSHSRESHERNSRESDERMHLIRPRSMLNSRESEEKIVVVKPKPGSNSRESEERIHLIQPRSLLDSRESEEKMVVVKPKNSRESEEKVLVVTSNTSNTSKPIPVRVDSRDDSDEVRRVIVPTATPAKP